MVGAFRSGRAWTSLRPVQVARPGAEMAQQ